mgnify:CR=1 FL=1
MILQVDAQWADVIVSQKQTNCLQRNCIKIEADKYATRIDAGRIKQILTKHR